MSLVCCAMSLLHSMECTTRIGSMECIGGADRTFACKSQECLWQDWYIFLLCFIHVSHLLLLTIKRPAARDHNYDVCIRKLEYFCAEFFCDESLHEHLIFSYCMSKLLPPGGNWLRLSGIVRGKKWVISHLMLVLSNGWFNCHRRLLHTAENHGPTMFHMATVRHKRWHPCLLSRTSLILTNLNNK